MCGIAGIWSPTFNSTTELRAQVGKMTDAILHRGPDDSGIWTDDEAGLALGHRRLAIVDLTPQGHQPMTSHSGRYVIVFNGEIYNFKALRRTLESTGYETAWRGHSDTEVLLAAIEQHGVEKALSSFVGMYAFAVWDRNERLLWLARDRLGEKPLYFGWAGASFVFGSELKALRAVAQFSTDIDHAALQLYVQYGCVPQPMSIFRDAMKLRAGSTLVLSSQDLAKRHLPEQRRYWSLRTVVQESLQHPFNGSEEEAATQLESLLKDVVRNQMVADVSLGALLSGGVDSSVVVALMQAVGTFRTKTFTIGFTDPQYDEAPYAKAVAQHLGTEHTELYVTPQEAMGVIPLLPNMFDEPFADSSQIPTYLVSLLARKHVTVSLSGDGGDEIFGGYNRYFWANALTHRFGRVPPIARRWIARAMTSIAPATWDRWFEYFSPLLPTRLRHRAAGDKIHKTSRLVAAPDNYSLYRALVSIWSEPLPILNAQSVEGAWHSDGSLPFSLSTIAAMMYRDAMGYLPDDILTKVDRATMSVSLESRAPMLDHRIVEFAWRLPHHMKIRGNMGKIVLRNVLYKHVPKLLIERAKMGFGVPLDVWLRGPLRDWAEALLSAERLKREGYFNAHSVRERWQQHLAGHSNWQHSLWVILMFQAWLDSQSANRSR